MAQGAQNKLEQKRKKADLDQWHRVGGLVGGGGLGQATATAVGGVTGLTVNSGGPIYLSSSKRMANTYSAADVLAKA